MSEQQIEPREHSKARGYLRARKLNGIPAVNVEYVRRQMDSHKKFSLPGEEGECELRLIRREVDRAQLSEVVSYMMEGMVYPYSVHLPAYQLGSSERATDMVKDLDAIIEAVDPALFVLHVSRSPLKKWGPEMGAVLRDFPPDRIMTLENVGVHGDMMRFPNRVSLVLDSIGAVPSNLGFCLDITHVEPRDPTKGTVLEKQVEIMETVFTFMGAMGPMLRHMHISNTRYEGNQRLQHMPLHDGFLSIARIKEALQARGFEGKCVMEFNKSRVAEGIESWDSL